ncbi:MAG: hypothetical protein HYZ28_11430 [Myxococcales bacterium]|nr:hypothetical protein [Myxococcales bacterium]
MRPAPERSEARELGLLGLCQLGLAAVFGAVSWPFFPTERGMAGHDYGYFLPQLLDGFLWYRANGPWEVPWFSPSFCGGVPALANPQNLFYSVPQALSLGVAPIRAAWLTGVLFAWLGFLGSYLLLRRAFGAGRAPSALGGGLFMLNGFFLHRMLIGHLSFHAFMLSPLLGFFLLRPWEGKRLRFALDAVAAGLLLAYWLYSGMVHLALPAVAGVLAVGLSRSMRGPGLGPMLSKLFLAGAWAAVVSSAKLLPALAFVELFPRGDYPLPGVRSLLEQLLFLGRALFAGGVAGLAERVVVGAQFRVEPQELEYGVSAVPLLLLSAAAVLGLRRRLGLAAPSGAPRRRPLRGAHLAALVALLCLPLLLNHHSPGWNAFLKSVPFLGASANFLRWYCLYLLPLSVGAALSLERVPELKRFALPLCALGLAAAAVQTVLYDRSYYREQPYETKRLTEAHSRFRQGMVPGIDYVVARVGPDGVAMSVANRNEALIASGSQLNCYEPMFGYRLEKLPLRTLEPGQVRELSSGAFNLKNPACYVYPKENGCSPGDHFTSAQRDELERFVQRKPFAFRVPVRQRVANWASLLGLVFSLGFLGYCGASEARRRLGGR